MSRERAAADEMVQFVGETVERVAAYHRRIREANDHIKALEQQLQVNCKIKPSQPRTENCPAPLGATKFEKVNVQLNDTYC